MVISETEAMRVPNATYRDAGKPNQAVPVTTECAEPGAFTPGPVPCQTGPTPIPSTDSASAFAEEVISGEPDFFVESATGAGHGPAAAALAGPGGRIFSSERCIGL